MIKMKNEINLNTITEALATFQGDPFVFLEEVWGLTPQPIKQRYVPMLEHLMTTPAKYFNLEVSLFHDDMFGEFNPNKHITWQQTILLIAVKRAINDTLPRQISVCSGKGTGKTFLVGSIILWFLFAFPKCRVMATAPTGDQLFSVLWSELSSGIQRMKDFYRDQYIWQNKFIRMVASPMDWFARAKTSGPGEHGALAGLHCFEEGTVEVMTKDGFKDFKDITTKDKVMTRIGWRKPSKVIREQYSGELIYQDGKLFSFSVTPHHKFPVLIRNGHYLRDTVEQWSEEKLVAIEDLGGYLVKIPRYIEKDFGKEQDVYKIPSYKNHYISQPQREAVDVPMDAWVAFLGWYLSEGSISEGRSIGIAQSLVNQEKREEIAGVITSLGFTASMSKNSIYLSNVQVAEHVKNICPGKALTKRVPKFIFSLSQRQIRIFLNAYMRGDGCTEKSTGRVSYITSSKGMANDLHRLILLSGGYATITKGHLKGSVMNVGDRHGIRNSDCYIVREWMVGRNQYAVSRGTQRKRKDYKGIVECLTVPSGMFYVRDKKTSHTFWTGNSDHMLAVVDEAASVEEGVIDEARYTMTNENNLIILISNAHTATSFFKSTFEEGSGWINIIFNAEESPIVSAGTIAKVLQDCGGDREHDKYRVHVRGLFPKAGLLDDSEGWRRMYDDKWINALFATDKKDNTLRSPYLGVDVGGEGSDSSEIYARDAVLARHVFSEGTSTPETVAKLTIKAIEQLEAESRDVSIDNFGTGADVSAKIALLSDREMFCQGVNVGMKCEDPDDRRVYYNERARLADMLLKWGIQGGRVVPDEVLRKELETIYCKEEANGKLQVMPKKKQRALGLKSCNRVDALWLTFAQDTAFAMRVPRGDHLYYPDRPEEEKGSTNVNPLNRHRMIPML